MADEDRVVTITIKAKNLTDAETKAVARGVSDIGKAAKDVRTDLADVKSMVAGAFTVGAVVSFGQQMLDVADHIKKMADQTSLSTDEVQRFEYIAGQSGSSVESLVGAVQNLQQKIGGGDKGLVSALKALNINFDDFARLNPYDQMTTLADAIGGIADPTKQASAAADVFGKNWKEILPAIKSGMKDLGDQAPLMANSTVEALDRVGDAMARAKQQAVSWAGDSIAAVENYAYRFGNALSFFSPSHFGKTNDELLKLQEHLAGEGGLRGALNKVKEASTGTSGAFQITALTAEQEKDAINDLNAKLIVTTKTNKDLAEATKKAAEEARRFAESATNLTFGANGARSSLSHLGFLMPDLSARTLGLRDDLDDLGPSFNELDGVVTGLGNQISTFTIPMFQTQMPGGIAQSTKAIKDATTATRETVNVFGSLERMLTDVNNKFTETAVVGLRAGQEISKIVSSAHDAGEKLSKGDWLGIAAIGVSAVATGIGKLFGNNAEKQINPLRQQFIDAAGGLSVLNARAHDAGVTLDRVLNAKNPESYKKAIDDLNAALAFQDSAMQTLDETAAEYGFTLAEMPNKFRQGKLDEQFLELFKKEQILTAGGFDFDAILQKQKGSFQELITAALQTGSTIPSQLRPAVERMAELGQLTDLSGEKMTDVSKLTWAESLDGKVTTLVESIQKLVDAIARGLGTALNNLPKSVPDPFHEWKVPSLPNWRQGDDDTPSFGTEAYVRRPTLAMVGDTPEGEFVLKPSTIRRWMNDAVAGARQSAASTNVYIVVDSATGTARQVTEGEFQQIQQRLNTGGLRVPTSAVVNR